MPMNSYSVRLKQVVEEFNLIVAREARLKILQANIACNSEWRGSRVAKGNRL